MEIMPNNCFLEIPEGTIESIRKIHNLDKPERLAESIDILETWIQKQDHFVKKDFSKRYLEVSLILCKGSVEKSKKQIDRLCTLKTLLPSFFSVSNVKQELQDLMGRVTIHALPKLTKDYYRVLLFKISRKGFLPENFKQFFQVVIASSEFLKAKDYVNGFIIIGDFTELNLFDYLTKMNTMELHQIMTIVIEGYGARLKNIHFITDSKAVEILVKIIKQVVSEKLGKRIHTHPTIEDIQKVVPKEVLPVEYGGDERSVSKLWAEWVDALSTEEHVEYMKMMNKACTDESKRDSAQFNEEYLGVPGSFRKLSVD